MGFFEIFLVLRFWVLKTWNFGFLGLRFLGFELAFFLELREVFGVGIRQIFVGVLCFLTFVREMFCLTCGFGLVLFVVVIMLVGCWLVLRLRFVVSLGFTVGVPLRLEWLLELGVIRI